VTDCIAHSWKEGRAPLRGKAKAELDARRGKVQVEKPISDIDDDVQTLPTTEPQDENSTVVHPSQSTQHVDNFNDGEQSSMNFNNSSNSVTEEHPVPFAPQNEAESIDEEEIDRSDCVANPEIPIVRRRKRAARPKQRKAVVLTKSSRHNPPNIL
jgi:hypothetical protein